MFTMRFLQLLDLVLDVQQPCRRLGFLKKRADVKIKRQ
jgi:hypothetical protein